MRRTRLLVVSPDFAPSALIGAKRPTKLVIRMRDYGWEPYVLTVLQQCCHHLDPSAPMAEVSQASVVRLPCYSMWQHSSGWRQARPGFGSLTAKVYRLISKITWPFLPIDIWYPWSLIATSCGVDLVRREKIGLMWASAPSLSGVHLAHRIWRRTGIPYIVDFRDVRRVPDGAKLPLQFKRAMRLEKKIVENAAGITYTAPAQIDDLHTLYSGSRNIPSELIHNWFERKEHAPEEPFDKPTILYGGSLYGRTRNLEGFFEALVRLAREQEEPNKGLQFLHFGIEAEKDYFVQKVNEYSLDGVVRLRELLPSRQFESHCRNADILLLVVGRNEGLVEHVKAIPGKIYDYFAVNRPILLIGPEDCEAGKLVKKLKRGIVVADNKPEEIARAIRLLLDREKVRSTLDLSDAAVQDFEVDAVLGKLGTFFGEVYKSHQR